VDEVTARTVAVAWRDAAEKLGLTGPGLLVGLRLDGCIGPFGVRIEECDGRTRIVVHDERTSALSLLRWHAPPRPATDAVVPTGDAWFDERVTATGDPVLVAALFDASLRRHVLAAAAGGGSFEGGVLRLDLPGTLRSAAALVSRTRAAVGLARRFCTPRDVAARLASNARRDPVPAVRITCLDRLRESFAARARHALRAALSDPDPAVRLRAATALPGTDQEALLALARSFEVDESLQARAIAALARPPARAMGRVLRAALKSGRRAAAREAIRALGLSRSRAALAPLTAVSGSEDAGMRLTAIRALGATGLPGAQEALVSVLGSVSAEEREAAASALGALGTVAAVGPLRAAVGAHPEDRGLRLAATRAIGAIQARAGAEPGWLSVAAESQAGALSLADSESGRLSLSPTGPETGRPGAVSERDDDVHADPGSDRSEAAHPAGVAATSGRKRRT
jgi:HEAT repeat protein